MSAYQNKMVEQPFSMGYLHKLRLDVDHNFTRFVEFVLSKPCGYESCSLNPHWRPAYVNCAFCAMDYDFIGRSETLGRDFWHIVTRRGG